MSKPLVAVVGRPNVGKSTFINKVCGKRISIVKDQPGVTRDRLYADAEWRARNFTLIDTGGIDDANDDITANVRRQAYAAVELCDVVIFITDGKSGLTAVDRDVADYLRRSKKPTVLAVNKLDNFEVNNIYEFYELGLGDPMPISSEHGKGVGDLLDAVYDLFPESSDTDDSETLKIAFVGKPNVGKSSLINKILGFDRVIVSNVAGTTRDAIDTPFSRDGKDYMLIDTAGLRRKREIEYDTVESYSVLRSISAIRRADVVLIVMDSTEPVTEQDVKIAGLVHEEGKPSVILMNKWDAVEKDTYTIEKKTAELDTALPFMSYYSSLFVSAESGLRVNKIFDAVAKAHENATRRIPTGALNEIIGEAIAANEPPTSSGRRLKVFYAAQIGECPPTFAIKVNAPERVHFSFERYLINCLRRAADFSSTPIRIKFVRNSERNER